MKQAEIKRTLPSRSENNPEDGKGDGGRGGGGEMEGRTMRK